MIQYRRMSISAKNVNYLFVVHVFWHIYNMSIDKIQLQKNLSFSKTLFCISYPSTGLVISYINALLYCVIVTMWGHNTKTMTAKTRYKDNETALNTCVMYIFKEK